MLAQLYASNKSAILICSTPHMSKMHADDTWDLRVVGKVMKEVLGVCTTSPVGVKSNLKSFLFRLGPWSFCLTYLKIDLCHG